MKIKTAFSLIAAANLVLGTAAIAAGAKSYQVTGTILEVKPTMIAVQKDGDRLEMDLDPQTKVTGELKVGSTVTITYVMSATKADATATIPALGAGPGTAKKQEPVSSPSPAPTQ
jgi:pheromone shutdown protein TraB